MKQRTLCWFLSVFTLFFMSCEGDDVPSSNCPTSEVAHETSPFPIAFNCAIDPDVQRDYAMDAYALAADLINGGYLQDTSQIVIPDEYVQNVLKALSAVIQFSRDQNDSLSAEVHHPFNSPMVFQQISLRLVGEQNVFDEWVNTGLPTSSCELNHLIETYNLTYDEYRIFNNSNSKSITVSSDTLLNTVALVRRFEALEDVMYGSTNGAFWDGHRITPAIRDDRLILEFKYGWGDCPSGCIYNKYWRYAVDSQCNVTKVEP